MSFLRTRFQISSSDLGSPNLRETGDRSLVQKVEGMKFCKDASDSPSQHLIHIVNDVVVVSRGSTLLASSS